MRRTDLISAGVLGLLGLLMIFVIIPRQVTQDVGLGDLPPALMPYVAAVLATAAALLLLVARLVRAPETDEPAPLDRASWLFVLAAGAVLAGAFVLMQLLGYLAGAVVLVAGFTALGGASKKATAGLAVLFPLALWLLFDRVLGFPLP
ncbi:MAG TPA: tripartite tricarboxylate transporter TctB family protein [Gammaproteobacteria bacterium]